MITVRRLLTVVLLSLCVVVLAGCGDNAKRIRSLDTQMGLLKTMFDLQSEALAALTDGHEVYLTAQKESLKDRATQLNTILEMIEQLQELHAGD